MDETLHLVLYEEPRPPRELLDTVPAELERICLKALSKRASDRYANATDFAEDLEQWLKPTTTSATAKPATEAVFKGLRAFDANDADFFLELLPGQRNRDGLPESIAFWKQRIEQTDPEQTFSVGLIYGPSGCGKSSLVKAGLLPNLSKDVVAVYLEATPDDTETRIQRGLEKRLPKLSKDMNLTDTLASLRRGQAGGKKVVIIIDQFEQWLHAHRVELEAELVKALRQCDGGNLQAIVMVRDDFSVAAARLMRVLDIPILEGNNCALVDLFDVNHATKVLTKFGQAFQKLPANAVDMSADEQQFVGSVSTGLAQDDKVVSIRLSLFAEMVKGKPWTTATLQQVGGTQGIGFNFLEETFSSPQANPNHRRHAAASRGVLRALLPELGTDIKGHMRSQQELLEASGYQNRPSDFTDLLRILDGELRLITPTDPEGDTLSGDASRNSSLATRYYQLTHDYLVQSLREWLTHKQKETRKGRAELKLEERTALWTAKPENRHLPSLREWISIRWLTETKHWTAAQRSVMNRAARIHGLRTGITVLGIGLIFAAALGLNRQADERRNQAEATRLVEGLLAANTAKVSDSLASLKPFRTWADAQLQQEFQQAAAESDAKLHAGLALLSEGKQVDPGLLKYLQDRLLTVSPGQIGPVRELMEPQKSELIPAYWTLAKDTAQPAALRFRAACALAGFDAVSSEWTKPELTALVADQLVAVSPEYIGEFKELLRPVAPQLVPALSTIFKDPNRGELAKTLTTSLLADYAANNPDTLTELILAADVVSDKLLFPVLQQHQATAVKNLEAVLAQRLEPDWKDAPLNPTWTEPSPAVRAQIESAHGLITDRFAFCQDMPLPQFLELAETLRNSGYRPTRVRPKVERLSSIVQNPAAPASDSEPSQAQQTQSQEERERLEQTLCNISAIWTRDSKRWQIDRSLSTSDLPAPDSPAIKDGLLLADIAPLPLADEKAEPQFIALWSEPANTEDQRRMLFDLTEAELTAALRVLTKEGFPSQSTISIRTDASGQRRYTAIWSSQGESSEIRPAYAGFERVHQPQWDVSVAPAEKMPDPLEYFRQQMAQIQQLSAEKLDEPLNRQSRATAYYQLGNLEAALADLDFLISKETVPADVLQYHILTLARLGKANKAKDSLSKYLATDDRVSFKLYVQIQMLAWLGEYQQARAALDSAVTTFSRNNEDLYIIACAAALCSQALSGKDAAQSQKFADRAFELLRQIITQGYQDADQLKSDPDFASLHADPRFLEVLSHLEPPATYAGLWRANIEYESKLLPAVPSSNVAEQLKPLLTQGWRPFAIGVNPVPSLPGKREKGADRLQEGANADAAAVVVGLTNEPLCSLVLHRPLIPDAKKESLALQQAAAATVLLRLNAADKVWPLFQDQPDPRLRSYVLHRLATYGVDPQTLFTQLQQESETSRRRSLIIGLGEFAKATLLSPEQTSSVTADLAQRYADDPDPGVHGAAEWTLRQLGADATIAEVRAAYSTGTAVGNRRWYLTKTRWKSATPAAVVGLPTEPPSSAAGLPSSGVQRDTGRAAVESAAGSEDPRTTTEQSARAGDERTMGVGMTFAILDAADEFLMGSPVGEAERLGGPSGTNDIRHRRQIGRRFAIGVHEVTVAQFQAFRADHRFVRSQEDSPAHLITWYDAAAYCNWLSDQEGLPRDQWCYDPEQEVEEGMTLLPDYFQRTGYRLPSEAEWEYACRAGTTTARYFGETEKLLGEYAWYRDTWGAKWMLRPVGTLRPNATGLFDSQGNVLEWCQDGDYYLHAEETLEKMKDEEVATMLDNRFYRVQRGGSLGDIASSVRSSERTLDRPDVARGDFGFRVSRTLNSVSSYVPPSADGGVDLDK